MILKMETLQPSSTRKQSGQADLLPRSITSTSIPNNFGSQQLTFGGRHFSQVMVQPPISASLGPYPLAFPNKHSTEAVLPSKKDQLPVSVHLVQQQSKQTSKFQSGIEPLPRSQNQASVNVGTTFTLTPSKHQAHQLSLINECPAQAELPVKVQAEFESVRTKLRESLAFALATGSKEQSKPKSLETRYTSDEKSLLRQDKVPSMQNEIHPSGPEGSFCENLSNYLNSSKEVKDFDGNQDLIDEVSSSGNIGDQKEEDITCDVQSQQNHDIVLDDVPFSHSIMEDELLQGHGLCWASDLTSVNLDSVLHSLPKRPKLIHLEENRDTKDTTLETSEKLATQIEAELFKLFGGVNKKYKEKGRSLLFNLKDPSNPELREQVLCGDVPPERLCSMSAEELASKELSQWRQAKAEEYAQMVMLPDMNIDIRRLVRKTHKGEFQVEVEQDDGAHPEVGLVSDVLSKMPTKANEIDRGRSTSNETGLSSRIHDSEISDELVQGEKSDLDERKVSSNLDPRFSEKPDFIQEFIVEEMKDTELPPVVSLDEFMQDLDSEPPFENLEINNLQQNTSSVDRKLDRLGSESIQLSGSRGHKVDSTPDIPGSKLASVNILDSQSHSGHIHNNHTKEVSSSNSGQVIYNYQNSEDDMKTGSDLEKQVVRITDFAPNYSNIWEGFLQLNVSALSNVVSFFLSGEKTSMQGWPNFVEVKGRVRLDAFEKFLQELPLSRSRAIMIVEFSWKENSMESGQLHLSEAIHSYITDERVGFAEPVPGVELYLCPPDSKITGMLAKHLSKELLDNVQCVVNGLIGIVVWRRPHVIVSPKVSSHHKHGGTRRHSGSKKQQESKTKVNSNSNSNSNHVHSVPPSNPTSQPDDIDDVPPGFGPPIAREVDDLPEFDFSRGSRFLSATATVLTPQHSAVVGGHAMPVVAPPAATALPSSHMRELIQKYGQGGYNVSELGIPVQPWNDEDDIPEWNPNQNRKQMHQTQPLPTPLLQLQGYQQQQRNAQPFMMNQQHLMPPSQQLMSPPPMLHTPPQPRVGGMQGMPSQNVLQQPHATWWPAAVHGVPPGGPIHPCHFAGPPGSGMPPVVGPRMVQGFGRANNVLSSWRPDNSGSRGF